MRTKKLAAKSILLAAALIIFVIEAQLPPVAPIPGVKLGLANIITLIAFDVFGAKDAFTILFLRIILASVFSGGFVGFIYSAAGALLCFAATAAGFGLLKSERIWVISVFGAIAHNAGQLIAAAFIISSTSVFLYAPILLISAVITGSFTGLAAGFILKRDIFKIL